MQPDQRDAGYLWDMLDAAKTIRQFTEGVQYEGYLQDRMMQLAVERELEIIGEASAKVSAALKQEHTEIAWRPIRALRNVLAHEYGEIEQDIIWRIATQRIPELIDILERLVPSDAGDGKS